MSSTLTDEEVFQQVIDTVLSYSKVILGVYFAYVGVHNMDDFMQIDEPDFDLPYSDVADDSCKDLYLQLILKKNLILLQHWYVSQDPSDPWSTLTVATFYACS